MILKNGKWDLIKVKNFGSSKEVIKEWKSKLQVGKQYLLYMYVTKDFYSEYLKTPIIEQ